MFKNFALTILIFCWIIGNSNFAWSGPAVIFNGNNVKGLKPNLDLNGSAQILTGAVDPTSSATNAKKGSLYLNNSSSNVYKKNDNGSTTNWTALSTGTGGTAALLVDGYYAGTATCVWNRSSSTLGPLNGGSLTFCPAFTVESPTTPPYTVTSSSGSYPSITLASLPAGIYEVEALINGTSTTAAQTFLGIYDGTDIHGVISYEELSSAALQKSIHAAFSYASSGTRTFTIYVATGTLAPIFSVDQQTTVSGGGPVRITVKRWQ